MASLLVQSPEIIHLIEDETGLPRDAQAVVGSDRDQVMVLYKALHLSRKTGRGRLLCALCGVPVYLCSAPDRQHFYFKHFHEDGSCPAVTRGKLSEAQINALRYHGQRESQRHIRIKHLVDESATADPAFSKPEIEGTWKGRDGKERRRPDVRSRFQNRVDVAFEVQLSTTFGRVMAEREVFYKSEGGLLLWVFGEFDLDHARLMMEVVFANNNRNAFVVNEATRDASIAAGALVLECHWAQPGRVGDRIVWTQQRKLVRFDELTIDLDRQRAYFVDTDALEAKLFQEIDGPPLAEEFQEFWFEHETFDGRSGADEIAMSEKWNALRLRFSKQGARLPSRYESAFAGMVRALFLAKLGRAIGWRYQTLWPAVHHVHDAHKPTLWIFMPALAHYGRLAEIEQQDTGGKWAEKVRKWERGAASARPEFQECHRYDEVIRLIFPELATFLPDGEVEPFDNDEPPPF